MHIGLEVGFLAPVFEVITPFPVPITCPTWRQPARCQYSQKQGQP